MPVETKTPDATCIVLGGASIVQIMKQAVTKTFDEYAQQVFIPYVSSQLCSVSRVDLVRDIYKDDSLKGTARANRGKGVRRRLVGNAAVPVNCQTFLQVDSRPFCRLTATRQNYSVPCLQAVCKEDKEVVLTSPIGSGCSAHSYCKISTPWLRAATKKLIVVCYCTYHTLHSMATTRCQLAL